MRPLKLGSAGIRGIVGTGIAPDTAIDFAAAFGTFTSGGRVIVAMDTRISSPMLRHAVLSALSGCGCEVIDAGIMPAPVLHFMTPLLNAAGALLIGGGHQAAGWNAIIPFNASGAYLNSIQLRELLDIYHSRRYLSCSWDNVHPVHPAPEDIVEKYLDGLGKILDVELIASRKFTVICDFCNGSGSVLAERFAEKFGIKMIPINNILSGIMPHDPEPRPRSGFQVQSIMLPLKADAGFVFNSDMSRMAVVSNQGETLSEEITFPLAADYLLSKKSNRCKVVTNICTTRSLDDIVKRHKCVLEKIRVGQASIIDRMKETGARLGGEGCGGFALADWVNGFDSFLAMGTILESMAASKCSLTELASRLPRYHIVKKTINCPSAHAYTLIRSLRDHFKDAKVTEGKLRSELAQHSDSNEGFHVDEDIEDTIEC